eukprot:gnl/TRDRNA2_/TRDRNA2_133658_c0_seq1.p1 gnl/TRDRNA2_/TRDRNA2_133658_c0~~gnl/TRDRNA2_/TRDRNA2_133658_c0_seq1.p1  ORF type:complete len:202 (+),score=9.01 gnl/TRDRNA2_/TRDRNA2_133658_c0_seq1:32-607(+)
MPAGRLDKESEGLLVLTTDGNLSFALTASKAVEKEYYVEVDGVITDDAIASLSRGVEIRKQVNKSMHWATPCRVAKLGPPPTLLKWRCRESRSTHRPTSWITITLNEGIKRQVRLMTAAVGHPTLRLVRVRVGAIHLGSLLPGELRAVTQEEVVASFKNLSLAVNMTLPTICHHKWPLRGQEPDLLTCVSV